MNYHTYKNSPIIKKIQTMFKATLYRLGSRHVLQQQRIEKQALAMSTQKRIRHKNFTI